MILCHGIEEDIGLWWSRASTRYPSAEFEDGIFTELVPPQPFVCKILNNASIPVEDRVSLDAFNKKVGELTRVISGADAYRSEMVGKLSYLKKAVVESNTVPMDIYNHILSIELNLKALNRKLNGDALRSRYEGASPTAIKDRMDMITSSLWTTTSAPTEAFIKSYEAAANAVQDVLDTLRSIESSITEVEKILEKNGAPYTPGRFPDWKK